MELYFNLLKSVQLFKDIEETKLATMLPCLDAKIVEVPKGAFLLIAGNPIHHIGIVLDGNVHIIKENAEGDRTRIAALTPGDFFGEALCCANVPASPVSVIADTNSVVMHLEFKRILHTCSHSCPFHTKLIENMLSIIAQKNIKLQNRMDVIGQKTIRLKVLTYLNSFSVKQGHPITIPFNREELSEFLCVDRTALSHELSHLKKDGILDYHKNHFRLL